MKKINGSSFKARHFRATSMSIAMIEAGIIPGLHMIEDTKKSALVRSHHDSYNIRPSIQIAL